MSTYKSSTKEQDLSAIAKRIASLFPTRFYRHYARWKMRIDPLYSAVFATLQRQPALPTLDIGCGIGLLALYLRERGFSGPIHGVDFDPEKIRLAQSVAHTYAPDLAFHHRDVIQPWPDCQGNVCILDVLQYLPVESQKKLLEKSVTHVATNGLLIIRSGLQSNHWRYRLTEFSDQLMNQLRLMKSPPITYPTKQSLEQILMSQGIRLRDCQPLYGQTPFNNYLLVFEREASGNTQRYPSSLSHDKSSAST